MTNNCSSLVSHGRLLGVRVSEELERRVEYIRRRLQARAPYTTVTASDAMRELLARGAEVLEDENEAA